MAKRRVAVLGGGITGAVLAGELARSDQFDVHVLERTSELGGLHRSVGIDGAWYDAGTILFSTNNRFFRVFPEVLSLFVPITCRWVSIAASGRLDGYPMTLGGYVRSHGAAHMAKALGDLALSKMRYCRPRDAGAYAKYYLGGTIYRESGLKAYMERLFCLRDDEIHLAFAHRRLGLLAYRCGLRNRAAQAVQGVIAPLLRIKQQQGPAVQEVVRPREGFAVVYRAIADLLRGRGVQVRTSCNIRSVRKADKGFGLLLNDDQAPEHFDEVISTVPVPVIASLLGEPCRQTFEYVPLLSLFYRLRGDLSGDATVLYNFTPQGNWKRITRFSAYYGKCDGEEYFTVEVAIRPGETLDVQREREAFEKQARELGICSVEPRYQGHVVTDRAYPIFRYSTFEQLQQEKQKLISRGIMLTGRQGDHDYISTLEAADGAWQVAQELMAGVNGSRSAALPHKK